MVIVLAPSYNRFILVNGAQFIAHAHKHVPLWIGGASNMNGFFWNGADFLWFE